MAHVWIQKSGELGRCWAAVPLAGWSYRFAATEPYVRRADGVSGPADGEILVRIIRDCAEHWFVLIAPDGPVWVSGQQAFPGVRVLADKDELRLRDGQRLHFSTEHLPEVTPIPGAGHEMYYRRCLKLIEKRTSAVACPACGVCYHQPEDLPCRR